jgi:dihydroflavonol-4-reductase
VQNPHTGKKILVTGASGLLGAHLVGHLLDQGYTHIRALRRPAEKTVSPYDGFAGKITWVEADILDLPALEEAMEGAEWVFHCAGLVSFDPRDAGLLREINIAGTANIVNLCLFMGVGKLLHVSSVAALGRTKPGQTISESSKWERSHFNTRYGTSKFLGEQEVWRGIEEGLNAVIINPSIVLGSGRWTDGPGRFFPLLHGGFPFYPAGATALVDARDVARMMLMMMESPVAGQRFIASAGHLSYKDFFKQIATALGRPAPKVKLSPILQHLAMRYGQLKGIWSSERRFITAETVRQSSLEFFYDNSKSIEQLGFTYTTIEKTIRDVAAGYLAHLDTK